jgi:hypothetical protein
MMSYVVDRHFEVGEDVPQGEVNTVHVLITNATLLAMEFEVRDPRRIAIPAWKAIKQGSEIIMAQLRQLICGREARNRQYGRKDGRRDRREFGRRIDQTGERMPSAGG